MGVNKEGTFNYNFTNEESETQTGGVTSQVVSQQVTEMEFEPRFCLTLKLGLLTGIFPASNMCLQIQVFLSLHRCLIVQDIW